MNLYNILFGILLTAGLAVGVYAVGPATFMDEARSFVGMEEETPVFVRPPVTAEETPVNPASVPAEQPVEEASDPTGDYLLGETEALARVIIDHKLEEAKPIPNSDKATMDYYGAPYQDIPGGELIVREVVPGYTSEFSGAFSAEANLPVGTICYGFNTWGDDVTGTWSTGDGQIRSDPCEEDYIPYRTSIEVSQEGQVTGSWWILDGLGGAAICSITLTAFYHVYYYGEYVSTEPVPFEADCEYDDPYYNGPEATETFSISWILAIQLGACRHNFIGGSGTLTCIIGATRIPTEP